MPGEEVILEINYAAARDGIFSALRVDAFTENLDVRTDTECVGKFCKT